MRQLLIHYCSELLYFLYLGKEKDADLDSMISEKNQAVDESQKMHNKNKLLMAQLGQQPRVQTLEERVKRLEDEIVQITKDKDLVIKNLEDTIVELEK